MAFREPWTISIGPGLSEIITPPTDLRLSIVTFAETKQDHVLPGRTFVKLTFVGKEKEKENPQGGQVSRATGTLCTLTTGVVENLSLDYILPAGRKVILRVDGINIVSLMGHYLSDGTTTPTKPSAAAAVSNKRARRDSNAPAPARSEKVTQKKLEGNANTSAQQVIAPVTDIIIEPVKKGKTDGDCVKAGDTVSVRLLGRIYPTADIFYESDRTTFKVGAREVIPGLDQSVIGMFVGTQNRIIIPPDFAWGAVGNEEKKVPPNTAVYYDCLVLEIE